MIYIAAVSLLVTLTVVAVFEPRLPAVLPAYAAMWLCRIDGIGLFSNGMLAFWGLASAIALAISYLVPRKVIYSRVGVGYINGGALVGAIVGMLSNTMAGVIVGSAAGMLFGGIAYTRTMAGSEIMRFPSHHFFNYLCAKGLPAVVALSMATACTANILALLQTPKV
ncbi:MAG: hypothetical protein ACI30N_05825 [Muribaculaceae bacterium]